MKLLTITNLFPPHFVGGFEIRCGPVQVRFLGKVLYQKRPRIYREHDLFVFPTSKKFNEGVWNDSPRGSGFGNGNYRGRPRRIVFEDGVNALAFVDDHHLTWRRKLSDGSTTNMFARGQR